MTHPSIDKHVKRIQSQLSRLGVRVSKDQIRVVYQEVVGDFANPTDEERAIVVEKLSKTQTEESSELATVEPTFNLQPSTEETEAITPAEDMTPVASDEDNRGTGREIIPAAAAANPVPTQSMGITPIDVTQAISQAIAQVGQQGNNEALEILTTLANELSSDIQDTQEMVTALVTAYLGKRQTLLSSAIGTLNTLRSAQTESFQAGLDQNFFGAKSLNKRQFLESLTSRFN